MQPKYLLILTLDTSIWENALFSTEPVDLRV